MNIIYDELIKRYMYLYENKELILAMCIRRINEDDNIKSDISKYEEYKRTLKISDTSLFDNIISELKSRLGVEKYYLCTDVSDEIISAYEEFLFSDCPIECTVLYNHIESLKNSPIFLESINDMINSLEERRSYNKCLNKVPTFTVWKILDYVRLKYLNNKVVLGALDKYYNIDRTIMTGLDSVCGYYMFGEECFDDEKLSKYPCSTIVSGVNGSYLIMDYKNNQYEHEDDYIDFKFEFDSEVLCGYAKSDFMNLLYNADYVSYDVKHDLYIKLSKNNKELKL